MLTPKQIEVLIALADGLSNKEIARKLGNTEGTVKIHMQNIFRLLRVHKRIKAAMWWKEYGAEK